MLMTVYLVVFYQIVEELGRVGSETTDAPKNLTDPKDAWEKFNKQQVKIPSSRDRWVIPDPSKTLYGEWLLEFNANKTRDEEKNMNLPKGMTVPDSWEGLAAGDIGQDPPPWAIVTNATGKPDYCFLEPAFGSCDRTETRWGYNSFLASCQKFTYSGCGGNENNFRTLSRCTKECIDDVTSKCQQHDVYIEYTQTG